jgi:hypothetical protein
VSPGTGSAIRKVNRSAAFHPFFSGHQLIEAVGLHRVWDRAPLVMATAGPAA